MGYLPFESPGLSQKMKKSQSCTHLQDFEKIFDLKNYTSYDSVSNADFKYIIFLGKRIIFMNNDDQKILKFKRK